jgi:ribonuclease R
MKGVVELHTNGNANVITKEGQKLFIYKNNTNRAFNKDIVNVLVTDYTPWGDLEGEVTNIIERHTDLFTGILKKTAIKKKYDHLTLDSKKMDLNFFILKEDTIEKEVGERFLVKLLKWERGQLPICKIIKSLGMSGENNSEMSSIIYEYNLPTEFPTEVEAECNKIDDTITEEEISKRRDFRNITTIAIDPIGSRDRDDSLSYNQLKNGNIEVGIHIADVSFYVNRDSEIDKEAYNRGQSIYLVDRVIAMIPEKISNGLCSLDKDIDKLTYSFIFEFDSNYKIVKKWFGKGVVHLDDVLSYEEAEEMITKKDNTYNVVILNDIAKILRNRRNVLSFHKQELNFILDDKFKPIGVNIKESLESHKLIEEFMLLTNNQVGIFLYDNKIPNIYRCHDTPDITKLEELKVVINSYGYELDINSNDIRNTLKGLLEEVKNTPEENMISEIIVRTMKMAYGSPINIKHYGLDTEKYLWTTSPIRRYIDIITHRQLTSIIGYGSYIN